MARLLERESELEVIGELLESGSAGHGSLGLIEGPAGIGKTSLVQAAGDRAAEAGALVMTARGDELEREFGFGVVRQLFEHEAVRDEGSPATWGEHVSDEEYSAAAPRR